MSLEHDLYCRSLYLPWCRHLESFWVVKPQHYADNLKCFSTNDDLLDAA